MKPVVHPTTEKLLAVVARELPQSLLLHGEQGTGLLTIASWLADKNKASELHPQNAKGEQDDASGTITVEMIRRLYETTRTKNTHRQIIIIDSADHMSHGAQNAFLKLLEEPNDATHFILTAHRPQLLLPTIRSRMQTLHVTPVTHEQTVKFIDSLGVNDPTKRTQLQFIAAGRPAELIRLVQDETYFKEHAAIIGDARNFLQGNTYTKMLVIQKYKADRPSALQLIKSCITILRRSVSTKPQHALILQLDILLDAEQRLISNQNIALQLARCVL